MRITLGCLIVVCAVLAAEKASAQVYPWCYGMLGGGTNCGFATLQQCQWAMSGNGGFCERNPFYSAPQPRRGQQPKRRS